ncbi:CAP domain-containing protein [Virgibacillus ainsalahensis]
MFKKVSIVTALSTALLFGGAFDSTADASANADQSSFNKYKIFYSVNSQQGTISGDDVNGMLDKAWSNLKDKLDNVNWNHIQVELQEQPVKEEQKQEKPAEEKQPKQEAEQPTEEKQPKQEAEQPTEEKQPEQEAEQPAEEQQSEQPVEQDKQEEQPTQNEEETEEEPVEQVEQPESSAPQQTVQEQEQQNQNQEQSQELNQFEQEVVELTNEERAKQGLSPLQIDTELSEVAREKSRDMAGSNYFAHNSPNYGSPFDMMQSFGIDYRTAGENIAKGQRTPAEVVDAWMNSEGHRANILNGDYTHIGVGYVEQGNHWTQQFIGK